MKKILQRIFFFLLGGLFMLGGFQIIIFGFIGSGNAMNSIYEFNGIERLMGLIGIGFGGLINYLIITKKTAFDEEE